MGRKRTRESVEKALSWRHLTYNKNNPRARRRSSVIGSPRDKCFGFSSRVMKVVLVGDSVIPFKRREEVESAVWSYVAGHPVAGKLLSNKD